MPDGDSYCYQIFRDIRDTVRFLCITPSSARLLEILREHRASGRAEGTLLGT
ncbi:MAG: hypothetical protein PHX10_05315 [Gallionellaceae bacterium]|nr:hypothetical protein [Gallionellaceae bacterium]